MTPWERDHRTLLTAYGLAQNPLCGTMVSLERDAGFTSEELCDFATRVLRVDALALDGATGRFEAVALHFVNVAAAETFVAGLRVVDPPTTVRTFYAGT